MTRAYSTVSFPRLTVPQQTDLWPIAHSSIHGSVQRRWKLWVPSTNEVHAEEAYVYLHASIAPMPPTTRRHRRSTERGNVDLNV
jgi:hypothetical protein